MCFFFNIGLEDEGLYRKPGRIPKANKLYKDAIEKGKMDLIDLTSEVEWETLTLATAVKRYLGEYSQEPLLTFALHSRFIECASKSYDIYDLSYVMCNILYCEGIDHIPSSSVASWIGPKTQNFVPANIHIEH